ncbi:unnamed protein product [Arctogadus glacialis]
MPNTMIFSFQCQTMRGRRLKGALSNPLLVLLLALQILVVAGLVRAQTCPSVCSCSNQFSKVICTRRNLRDVPDGISTNTRYLNLQDNLIQIIKVDSFKHLRHLEILQLSKNHIRSIEIGAFNGLASLNTLELFDNRPSTITSQRASSSSSLPAPAARTCDHSPFAFQCDLSRLFCVSSCQPTPRLSNVHRRLCLTDLDAGRLLLGVFSAAMERHLSLPPLEHYNHYNTYKSSYHHPSVLSSLHSPNTQEPLLIQACSKDNVQETQI